MPNISLLPKRKPVGKSWRLGETYIKVKRQMNVPEPAMEKEGNKIEFLLIKGETSMLLRSSFSKLLAIMAALE